MRIKPNPADIAELYIDESSQSGSHRYLVLGCIVVGLPETRKLCELITKARMPDLPQGEAKWTKVSRTKLAAYKRVVDVLFDNRDLAHFHSLVVDTTQLDHHAFNQGDREIGFNKEIYQLARKCWRCYRLNLFHVYPDRRKTTQLPETLRDILNMGCKDNRDWPFRRCQFRESSDTLPLQLVDILIGGIAYRLNGHVSKPDASPAKIELSAYILDRAGVVSVSKDTARTGRFTIWHRQLRKASGSPRSLDQPP